MKSSSKNSNICGAAKPKKRHGLLALIIIAASLATMISTIFVLCKFVLPKFAPQFEPDEDDEETDGEENEDDIF